MKEKLSSRHHYIPQFLTKGFTNENGMVYIYNKLEDKIIKNPRSTKSIFFENDRNTVQVDGNTKSSILEDFFFQKLDDTLSKTVKKLQTEPINGLLSNEDIGHLQFFVINLFWRLPLTDHAVADLIERAQIRAGVTDIVNDADWNKVLRSGLCSETIQQSVDASEKPENYYAQISEFEDEIFIIGDFPVLFKNYLSKFTDLVNTDFYMALSSKRIFAHSLKPIPSLKTSMFLKYNASIIDQSKHYVASSNLKLLEGSVEFYKELQKHNFIYRKKSELFDGAE